MPEENIEDKNRSVVNTYEENKRLMTMHFEDNGNMNSRKKKKDMKEISIIEEIRLDENMENLTVPSLSPHIIVFQKRGHHTTQGASKVIENNKKKLFYIPINSYQ